MEDRSLAWAILGWGACARVRGGFAEDEAVTDAGASGGFFSGVNSWSMLGTVPAVVSPVLFSFEPSTPDTEPTTLETEGESSLRFMLPASSSSLVQIASICPSPVKDA